MTALLATLFRDRKGATVVEYGLILALIFLAILGAVSGLGKSTISLWSNTSAQVQTAVAG